MLEGLAGVAVLLATLAALLVSLHLVRLGRDRFRRRRGRPSVAEQIEAERRDERRRRDQGAPSQASREQPLVLAPWRPIPLPERFTRPRRRARPDR